MIGGMPRPRPPHLHRETSRHGRVVWYVRIGQGPRQRLRAAYGTPEFQEQYAAALDGKPVPAPGRAKAGTLQWLYEQYRETEAWRALSRATRRQRENIFRGVMATAGDDPARAVTRAHIQAGKDRRAATPAQSRNFLDAMRGLFRWALEAQHVAVDPTAGVRNPKRPRTGGFPAWTEVDVAMYAARWPIGTKERVWLDMLLYTGFRRGDAVRLGRQHVRDGIATLRTEKSQGEITVTIPILPVLARTLAAGPTGDLSFICGARGGPLTKETFGNDFSAAAREAGVRKSAHGVRKAGATRAAENGATEADLDALFGWERGSGMSRIYTRNADRARLGRGAAAKLERTPDEQSIPAPAGAVRAVDRK